MYSESDLEAAVAAGAISQDEAARFRNFVATSHATPAVDEEHFRLLTGFNDIFVSIAAVILLVAVGWIGKDIPIGPDHGWAAPFAGAFVAATAWGLAEYFTRKRRMALPSIILLLSFVGGVFNAFHALGVIAFPTTLSHPENGGGWVVAAAAALAAGAAWLHWRRFRVPITVAAGGAAVVGIGLAIVAQIVGDREAMGDALLTFTLISGIGMFAFAMWWDSSDPRRETRRSDVAFWLHLLAAPMIVHPVFALLGLTHGSASAGEAVAVIVLYVVLGVAALAIDRRALLVSALAYVLYALSRLFDQFGAVELNFALTALVIGSALLLLSAFWQTARAAVVRSLSPAIQAKLPVLDRFIPQPAS